MTNFTLELEDRATKQFVVVTEHKDTFKLNFLVDCDTELEARGFIRACIEGGSSEPFWVINVTTGEIS